MKAVVGEKDLERVTKYLQTNYVDLISDVTELKVFGSQGWNATIFEVGKYLIKFFKNFDHLTRHSYDQLRFSYFVAERFGKILEKSTVKLPVFVKNKVGSVFTGLNDKKEALVVMEKIQGKMLHFEKEFPNFVGEMGSFLKQFHAFSKEAVKVCLESELEVIQVDMKSCFSLGDRCVRLLNDNRKYFTKTQEENVKLYVAGFRVLLDQVKPPINDSESFVLTHNDLCYNAMEESKTQQLYLVDWDRVMLAPFEFDMIYFPSKCHEKVLKIVNPDQENKVSSKKDELMTFSQMRRVLDDLTDILERLDRIEKYKDEEHVINLPMFKFGLEKCVLVKVTEWVNSQPK